MGKHGYGINRGYLIWEATYYGQYKYNKKHGHGYFRDEWGKEYIGEYISNIEYCREEYNRPSTIELS